MTTAKSVELKGVILFYRAYNIIYIYIVNIYL